MDEKHRKMTAQQRQALIDTQLDLNTCYRPWKPYDTLTTAQYSSDYVCSAANFVASGHQAKGDSGKNLEKRESIVR